jgi:uncharacterized protein YcbK (DUF882 family)
MSLSRHFHRSEFSCSCGCGFAAVDLELVAILEDVRSHFNSPVIITSGCRCEKKNTDVGGEKGSFHLKGMAVDFKVMGVDPAEVATYLEDKYSGYGIGRYSTWTHLDVRNYTARWKRV